ncbi:aminotransferase class III-fold pyridoxal phosphate-dependent enzyme [Arthrobacter sp. 4R501]|uniref:aminotransferase class III-fold pyridoxal phosphate-dependent enzyme n=1 Tax=Arthrobacter sp. 4R501 TaxID=2058886 RepID=UPI000CE5563D|nr:aminotransferase class III-fold pyridoxal phosphate-dependent enzyme [Arthrobacter sp. 4R501]
MQDDLLNVWKDLLHRVGTFGEPPGAVANLGFIATIAGSLSLAAGVDDKKRAHDIATTIDRILAAAQRDIEAYWGDRDSGEESIANTPGAVLLAICDLKGIVAGVRAANRADLESAQIVLEAAQQATLRIIQANVAAHQPAQNSTDTTGKCFLPAAAAAQEPLLSVRSAHGSWLTTENGDQWLDASSGMWNVPLGHGHSAPLLGFVQQASAVAAIDPFHVSTNISVQVASRLAELSGMPNAYVTFASSGSEVVESALRLGLAATSPGNGGLWSYPGGYHGSTAGAASLSDFASVWPPYPERQRLARQAPPEDWSANGVGIIEPLSGVSGCRPISMDTIHQLSDFQKRGGVLIADEIACGLGRASWPLVAPSLGMKPDIILLGKGLGNGVAPISALICSPRVYELALRNGPIEDGHTHSNHPAALGAALGTLNALQLIDFNNQENQLNLAFNEAGLNPSGLGHFRAFSGPARNKESVRGALLKERLMIHLPTSLSACSSLILAPPFNMSPEDMKELSARTKRVVSSLGWM